MKTETESETNSPKRQARAGGWNHKWLVGAVVALIGCALSLPAQPSGVGGKKDFTCYQANAYIGAEYERVMTVDPSDVVELLTTVTEVYGEILASDPPKRMAALADEIIQVQPDVLGVEELWTLETGVPGNFTVDYDYLELLTDALAAKGAHYAVAVVSSEQDLMMPMFSATGGIQYGRVIDHEAILYRTDLPPGYLQVSNPRKGQFATYMTLTSLGLDIRRGWCAVDVFTRGERFAFICAHTEDEMAPAVQEAQGLELLAGPANVKTPVVIVGDFNADPLHRTGTTTYSEFTAAGFSDAWLQMNPGNTAGGLTWGHDASLANPANAFIWRLDYVLYRGNVFTPAVAWILDPQISAATPPLWPSDHAAVGASFFLGNPKAGVK